MRSCTRASCQRLYQPRAISLGTHSHGNCTHLHLVQSLVNVLETFPQIDRIALDSMLLDKLWASLTKVDEPF